MTHHTFDTFAYPLDRDGQEHEVKVRVSYDCDYEPAKLTGPWEDCHPASGDLDMCELQVLSELPAILSEDEVIAWCADNLEQECWDDYHGA